MKIDDCGDKEREGENQQTVSETHAISLWAALLWTDADPGLGMSAVGFTLSSKSKAPFSGRGMRIL